MAMTIMALCQGHSAKGAVPEGLSLGKPNIYT
jgi:hypothetical protein